VIAFDAVVRAPRRDLDGGSLRDRRRPRTRASIQQYQASRSPPPLPSLCSIDHGLQPFCTLGTPCCPAATWTYIHLANVRIERRGTHEQRSSVLLFRAPAVLVVALAAACQPTRPGVIASRLIPSVTLGQFRQHELPPPAVAVEQLSLYEAPLPPLEPKTEPTLPREVLAQPTPPVGRRARLSDESTIRLIESGRALFVRCFRQAYALDPTVSSFKIHLYVDLDPGGVVTSTTNDATTPELAACLARASKWLRFPSTEQPVAVDLPLVYRVE
jgi:hypothetical protein